MSALQKWIAYWNPLLRGRYRLRSDTKRHVFDAINGGTALLGGRFWQRIHGGYALYQRDPVRGSAWTWAGRGDGKATTVKSMPMFAPPLDRTCEYRISVIGAGGVESSENAVRRVVTIDSDGALVPDAPNPVLSFRVEVIDVDTVRLSWYYNEDGQQGKPIAFDVFNDATSPGTINLSESVVSVPYRLRAGYFSVKLTGIEAGTTTCWQVRSRTASGTKSGPSVIQKVRIGTGSLNINAPFRFS